MLSRELCDIRDDFFTDFIKSKDTFLGFKKLYQEDTDYYRKLLEICPPGVSKILL